MPKLTCGECKFYIPKNCHIGTCTKSLIDNSARHRICDDYKHAVVQPIKITAALEEKSHGRHYELKTHGNDTWITNGSFAILNRLSHCICKIDLDNVKNTGSMDPLFRCLNECTPVILHEVIFLKRYPTRNATMLQQVFEVNGELGAIDQHHAHLLDGLNLWSYNTTSCIYGSLTSQEHIHVIVMPVYRPNIPIDSIAKIYKVDMKKSCGSDELVL